jgi:hypothetical protein
MRKSMSMQEFCTILTIQKNLNAIKKAWPDDIQLKGRGHARRSYVSKVKATSFMAFGFIPKQIASTCDGKSFQWSYIVPVGAAILVQDLTQLADLDF